MNQFKFKLKIRGFTLIEILIALTVFAIMATITSSTLYYAFNTRTRVNAQADRLNEIQMAVSIAQQDITQIISRGIRGNEMRLFPVLVGQKHYLEFTRGGYQNPSNSEKRSTLKRVGWVCVDGNLVRRTWTSLDPVDRNIYHDKLLLRDLKSCHFNYLNQNLQVLTEWREQQNDQNATQTENLPKAIQINVVIQEWGEINLLFIIPGAVYATP